MRNATQELASLVEHLGAGRIASICRVHRTTVGRWLKGQVPVPESAILALRAYGWGEMPGLDRCWDGWFFRDGLLWSPDGNKFDPGEINALVYMRPLVIAQRKQIVELEAQLVAATKEATKHDPAANDRAIWEADVRSKAFGK